MRKVFMATIAITGTMLVALSVLHHIQKVPRTPKNGIPGYSAMSITNIQSLPDNVFVKSDSENILGFVSRITQTVHHTTYNCAASNYDLTWAEKAVWLAIGAPNVFADGILIRSRFDCGFCHQRAFLAREVLHGSGIPAEVYGLDGHVVVRLELSGQAFFTDPDLGVGPFPIDERGTPIEHIRDIYANSSAANITGLTSIYGNISDDAYYGGLDYASHYQARIFSWANWLALGAAALGITLVACSLLATGKQFRSAVFGRAPSRSRTSA